MKRYLPIAIACAIVAGGAFVGIASANPSYFMRCNNSACPSTSVATTTVSYMTAGTATTTISFDTGRSGAQGADSAALLAQFTASSTASKLAVNFEYSQDNVDWYQSNISAQATTTATQDISGGQSFLWTFASSTVDGVPNQGNRLGKIITVPTPTRYVRAVFTVPVGASAGGVWAEFVAKQQASQ